MCLVILTSYQTLIHTFQPTTVLCGHGRVLFQQNNLIRTSSLFVLVKYYSSISFVPFFLFLKHFILDTAVE